MLAYLHAHTHSHVRNLFTTQAVTVGSLSIFSIIYIWIIVFLDPQQERMKCFNHPEAVCVDDMMINMYPIRTHIFFDLLLLLLLSNSENINI